MQRLAKILIPLVILCFIPLAASAKIYFFSFDYAQFKGANGKTKLETYSSFSEKNLKYSYAEGKFSAKLLLNISFSDLGKNSEIFNQTYTIPINVSDTSKVKLNENQIIKLDYDLAPGSYRVTGIGSDANDATLADTVSFDVTVASFDVSSAQLSEIQLSTAITNSKDTSSMFYKNTLEVIPNPSGLFGNKLKEIFYYIELYNLNQITSGDNLKIDLHILDKNLKDIYVTSKTLKKGSDSRVDIGKFSIDSFPSGPYSLKYDLLSAGTIAVSKEKKFYIYNSGISSTNFNDDKNNDYLRSEFGSMTSDAADKEYEKLIYIITTKEKEYYNKLTKPEDKGRFLFDFWRARGNTPANNLRINFFKRIEEANRQFSESFMTGWKTDRGRLYIIYGPPDNIDRHPFESNSHAYEEWKWDRVEGGAIADFVERESETGIYSLVNSTLKNEVSFPEWKTYYKISGF